MDIKIKCEPFSHRNERSHHLHCHCFIWRNRNRNRNSSRSTILFIIETCFVFIAIFSYVLIPISSYLCDDTSTFFSLLLLQHLLFFILNLPNIHPHFWKKKCIHVSFQMENKHWAKIIFILFFIHLFPPPTHSRTSSVPSLLSLSFFIISLKYTTKESLKLDTWKERKKSYFNVLQ